MLRHDKMVEKKKSDDYKLIRGHVHKEVFKRFKIWLIDSELDNSQGLENALNGFFSDLSKTFLQKLSKKKRPTDTEISELAEMIDVDAKELTYICDRILNEDNLI